MELQDTKENRLAILSNLGYQKFKENDYITAIAYYNKYLEIDDTNPVIYNMIGYLYQRIDKYSTIDVQIEHFEKAYSLDTNYVQAIRNLALAYPIVERYEEAISCFQRLFKLGPVSDDYMAYACLQIRLKNFEEGWKYYEYRFLKTFHPTEYPETGKPRWEGQDISDKTLLVQYEQGMGDTIQFFRYLEWVKPLAKKVIFRIQNELVDLVKANVEGIDVVSIHTPLEQLSFDYDIPLISILNVMNAQVENIPLTQGYIKADEPKVLQYKERYFNNDCLKIGISYNGMRHGNKHRDIPLECFYPLFEMKNVKLYSFQKGHGAEQLANVPKNMEIVDLGETFHNFADTAAAMANVDLFITSDNSVFNLAGAMGIKTFVLLNKHAEWRWFLDEEKTPWYDSVKIFKKQNILEDWPEVIRRVIKVIQNGV